jgi:hypothetical protein
MVSIATDTSDLSPRAGVPRQGTSPARHNQPEPGYQGRKAGDTFFAGSNFSAHSWRPDTHNQAFEGVHMHSPYSRNNHPLNPTITFTAWLKTVEVRHKIEHPHCQDMQNCRHLKKTYAKLPNRERGTPYAIKKQNLSLS